MNLLLRIANLLIYGGSWTLRPYELEILKALERQLELHGREVLGTQLSQLDHVKRLHSDRMVTFHFQDAERLPKLPNDDLEFCIAAFEAKAGATRARVSVFTSRGLLSSLEFTTNPRSLTDATPLVVSPLSQKGASITMEVDQEEHGS